MVKLIFGCGYLGSRVAESWLDQGQQVFAVTRAADRAAQWKSHGFHPIVADVTEPASLAQLPPAETVLIAIGFDRHAGPSIHDVYVTGLKNILKSLPPTVKRLLYISSTGVYGQTDRQWVNESSVCEPIRAGGRACLEAEQTLNRHPLGELSVTLRLGGLYGPGRIPRRRPIMAGQPIAAPTNGYLNLIHVDDAVRATLVAEGHAPSGSVYCLTDGTPVERVEYYRYLAGLLKAPRPTFTDPPPGAHATLRSQSNKRVDSSLFRRQFDFSPVFPSYREGLAEAID